MNAGTFDPSTDVAAAGVINASQLYPTGSGVEDGVNYVEFTTSTLTGGSVAYSVGENSVILPVELLGFEAVSIENTAVLTSWATASEVNADRFEVERSVDNRTWQYVGETKASGNSDTKIVYELTDFNPHRGTSFYRLRQIDFDGSELISKTQMVHIADEVSDVRMMVFPNPNGGAFKIALKSSEISGNVQLLNALGQVVRQWELSHSDEIQYTIEVAGLASGTYTVRWITPTDVLTSKVVVE